MSSVQCPHCGSTEIDQDPSRGDVVCMQCGSILEESVIVSEVQYAQDCSGATRAIGQLVRAEGSIPSGYNLGHGYGFGKESREITLQNAKKKISNLAAHLKLPDHYIDIAHNFYNLALMKKLTQGRKNPHVIAACVYMVCRKESTHHMLLDLSDVLQVNVYDIGKTYLKLTTELCINIPAIDPSLYILRFAHQLEFGDKTHEVSVTASRLVARMKRDWMHTGRRPSGLCGAALLVAARLHNFNRSVDDVIKVVKVCQATVRKRLTEFGDTPSSRLTFDEFMTIDLEEEQDPPAFKAARKKKSPELNDESRVQEATKQICKFQHVIEEALENVKRKKLARYLKSTEGGTSTPDSVTDHFITKNTIEVISKVLQNENVTVEKESSNLEKLLSPANPSPDSGIASDSACSSFVTDDSRNVSSPALENSNTENGCLDLTGIDDAEIDYYIMDDEETKSKTEFWFKTNEDFLQKQKEKEEKRVKEELENANKEQKKKRKRPRAKIQANTTEEAIEKVLQQKKISLKLDYTVLKNLNSEAVSAVDVDESASSEPDPAEKRPPKRIRPSRAKTVFGPLPSSIRQGISDLIGNARSRTPVVEDDVDKTEECKEKEPLASETNAIPTTSGYLDRADESSTTEAPVEDEVVEEDYDEEDEEDDDDGMPSVAELLSRHRGEDQDEADFGYGDYGYMEDD